MELAPEVGQRLFVRRVRPERAGDALPRNRPAARVKDQQPDDLLLSHARDTSGGAAVVEQTKAAEQFDAQWCPPGHAQGYTRTISLVLPVPLVRNWSGTLPALTGPGLPAPDAGDLDTDEPPASFRRQHPRPVLPRWVVPHVLTVTALEFSDPVALVVLMKADDRPRGCRRGVAHLAGGAVSFDATRFLKRQRPFSRTSVSS